jgi:hypothetical protein
MENHLLLILDFDQLTRASIGTTGPTSLSQIYFIVIFIILINIYIINYLLYINHINIGPTCTLYIITRVTGRSDS